MKKILPLALLLFTITSSAQFDLEHTYTEAQITRVKLEYSGEKYYLFNKPTNELKLFNADHTPWKTLVLPITTSAFYTTVSITNVSEAEFNTDANLEIAFSYSDYESTPAHRSKVITENGDLLFDLVGANYIALDKSLGFP
jgi:hypothetical protein